MRSDVEPHEHDVPVPAIRPAGALAVREDWTAGDDCPVSRTLHAVGTRSAFLLLREAFYGATRFEQFAERARLSQPVTAARLGELHAHGLLTRVPYRDPGQRTRHAYYLTDKGRDLLPVLVAMFTWGERWEFPHSAPVRLTHAGCGAHVQTVLHCSKGHDVEAGDIELRRRKT